MAKCIDRYAFGIQLFLFIYFFLNCLQLQHQSCQMEFLQSHSDGALFDVCETALSQP